MKIMRKRNLVLMSIFSILVLACVLSQIEIKSNKKQINSYYNLQTNNKSDIKVKPMVAEVKPAIKKVQNKIYLGEFIVTAYSPCIKCCGKADGITASGVKAKQGITIGTDWLVLSEGTTVYIEGVGQRTVQDKTAKWINKKYHGKIIDLYFNNYNDARNFGKRKVKVYLIK